jgi:hypothetical protein
MGFTPDSAAFPLGFSPCLSGNLFTGVAAGILTYWTRTFDISKQELPVKRLLIGGDFKLFG